MRNIYFIFTSVTPRSRGLFLLSLAMMITCLATLVFGVYSPFYTNGHLSVFFIALCNIYVWALIYLNWPAGFETDFSTAAGGALEAVANTGVDKSAQKPNEEGLQIQFERGAKKSTAAGMRIENSTTHNEEDVFASQNQVEETKEGHHQQLEEEDEEEEYTEPKPRNSIFQQPQRQSAVNNRDIHIDF